MSQEDLGCDVCREGWYRGERPEFILQSDLSQSLIYRCAVCGTYWEMTERYAAPIPLEKMSHDHPDVKIVD